MQIVDEAFAWRVVHAFARDCLHQDPGGLRAIYAVGPLAGGYYHPGSELSVVLIAADDARTSWGRCFAPGPVLAVLNERYRRTYQLSSDSGASVLLESELSPPYLNGQAVPLIARLKCESRLLWGNADLLAVPMPSGKDLRHAARQYERWWAAAYPSDSDVFQLDLAECVTAIREHIFRYLWIHCEQIEFQPSRQLADYQAANPPCSDPTALRLVERSLAGHDLSPFETDLLRAWLIELRQQMNAYLHI
jgi:hypothetical protein